MDYVAAAALSPGSKLTTPTAFGLVNPTPGNYDAAPPPAAAQDIDTSKTPWQRFESYVHGLNKSGPASVRYKIVFLTRHGIGYHNLMEAKVGTEAWDVRLCFCQLLYTFFDARPFYHPFAINTLFWNRTTGPVYPATAS